MINPPNISAFVDDNNRQIVTNFSNVLFNTQVKELKYDGHLYKLINFMLASLPQNNKALRFISVDANMITVSFIQAVDVLFISSDILKTQGENIKEKMKELTSYQGEFKK